MSPCHISFFLTASLGLLHIYRTDFIIFCSASLSEKIRLSSATSSQTNNTAPNIYYHRRVVLIEEVAFAFYSDLWNCGTTRPLVDSLWYLRCYMYLWCRFFSNQNQNANVISPVVALCTVPCINGRWKTDLRFLHTIMAQLHLGHGAVLGIWHELGHSAVVQPPVFKWEGHGVV